jgi:hypothetical protein
MMKRGSKGPRFIFLARKLHEVAWIGVWAPFHGVLSAAIAGDDILSA